MLVWNLQTLQPWRVYASPCIDVFAHPSTPTFAAVFAATDAADAAVVVRFVGRVVAPAGAYACRDGPPEAVLFPPGDRASRDASSAPESVPMLVVTRDREIVRVGAETNREARARDDMDVDRAPVARWFPGGTAVAGAPVSAETRALLAETRDAVRSLDLNGDDDDEDVPTHERVIGGAHRGVGKMPWGALFDAPSHELPPLTALCPRFMDAMLARQANPDAE